MKFQCFRLDQFCWRKDLKGIAIFTFPFLALFAILYLVMGSVFSGAFYYTAWRFRFVGSAGGRTKIWSRVGPYCLLLFHFSEDALDKTKTV